MIAFLEPVNGANALTFDKDHIIYLNGEKFFPIGIYNLGGDPADHALAKACGFNTIQAYVEQWNLAGMQWTVNEAAANGLYIVLNVKNIDVAGYLGHQGQVLDLSTEPARKQALINETIDTFRNDWNLLSFNVCDEPTFYGISPAGWLQGVQYLRNRDTRNRTFGAINDLSQFPAFAGNLDIISCNRYPQFTGPNTSNRGFGQWISLLNEADRTVGTHGVNATVQAFVWTGVSPHIPTEPQIRCQALLGICLGAKSCFAYAMQNSGFHLKNYPGLQNVHKRLNADLLKLSPVWLEASSNAFSVLETYPDIYTYARNVDNAVYLLAVHANEAASLNSAALDMEQTAWNPGRLWVYGEDRLVPVMPGNLVYDSFAPYADHLYTSAFAHTHLIDSEGAIYRAVSQGPPVWTPADQIANLMRDWGWHFTSAPDSPVQSLGTADFDNDGWEDLCVIFDTGEVRILNMNAAGIISNITLGNFKQNWGWWFSAVDTIVKPLGVGDINGDGHADIVTVFDDGTVKAILTNGTNVVGLLTLGNPKQEDGTNLCSGSTAYRPVGVGDLDRDGFGDIFTVNRTGTVVVFKTNGSRISDTLNLYADLHSFKRPIKVADISGDGLADLCTVDCSGRCAALVSNGTLFTHEVELGGIFDDERYHSDQNAVVSLALPYGWGWENSNPADLNFDRRINFLDLVEFCYYWGIELNGNSNLVENIDGNRCPSSSPADINRDGFVNFADFTPLARLWLDNDFSTN